MSRGMQKAPKVRIRSREHMAQALELRKAGASYSAIGQALGLSKTRAYDLVVGGLEEINAKVAEGAEAVKRLELERCDAILLGLWKQRGNPRVADSILRVMDRRARLLGLDAPVKIAPTNAAGEDVPALDLSKLTNEELDALDAITAKAQPDAPAGQ